VPVFVPLGDEPKFHIYDMEPNQIALVERIITGISHIETVILHTSDEIVLFLIELYGKIEECLVALCLDSRVIFRNVEVIHPENVGALSPSFVTKKYCNQDQQSPNCSMVYCLFYVFSVFC